jgi:sarcosine oxidase subunit beta
LKRTADVIVIGAGVIGAATAFELAKSGRDVLVVDRLPAAGYGSTSSSSAIIRCYYSTVQSSSLAWESYHVWRRWADYVGDCDERGLAEFREIGCLAFKDESNDFLAPVCQVMDAVGIPYAHWDRDAIAARLPYFDLRRYGPPQRSDHADFGVPGDQTIPGAVFFPNAGYVNDPQLAAHNLQRAAEQAGARFQFNAEVATIRKSQDRVCGLSLADGSDIDAPVVVNIGGPNSRRLNEMAGVLGGMKISTRALRKEVCYLPAPSADGFDEKAPFVSDPDIGGYCRPDVGGKVIAGSLEPACDELVWIDDPINFDRSFSEQWTTQAMRLGMRIPKLGIPGQATGVVDLYDVSDDWIPIYDCADLGGFYMACGTSGNQFKNAPVAGALMTALIDAVEGGRDHDADPLQFELPRTNRILDLSAFSRRRERNRESSFSVLG